MIVTRLKLVNVRAIEAAEFTFKPGFNLIVGVNGVGKSTVLEMLSRELAHAIKASSGVSVRAPHFEQRDIRYGAVGASALLEFTLSDRQLTVSEQRLLSEGFAVQPGKSLAEVDVYAEGLRRRGRLKRAQRDAAATHAVSERPTLLPEPKAFRAAGAGARSNPLAVLFSTQRARTAVATARAQRAVGSTAAAYVEALTSRELQLNSFAEWIHALRETAGERPEALGLLRSLDSVLQRFLPGCIALGVSDSEPRQLLIQRTSAATFQANRLPAPDRVLLTRVLQVVSEHMSNNWLPAHPSADADTALNERRRAAHENLRRYMPGYDGIDGPLDRIPFALKLEDIEGDGDLSKALSLVRMPRWLEASRLSDGERGTLALVLDLTRRLALANPKLEDPAANGSAVVLIDELELHLHPKWQREVCGHLESAFPRCQFIATTHSPQVVGEIPRDRVHVLTSGGAEAPSVARGADSNWILDHVMDAASESSQSSALIGRIEDALAEDDLASARSKLGQLRLLIDGETGEVARLEGSISSLELLKNQAEHESNSDADD